jgi:hypothetical protein
MNVYTVRKSVVHLLAMDKSLLLLNNGNDLTKGSVFDDLGLYNRMDYWFDDLSDRDNEWFYVVDNYENEFTVCFLLFISSLLSIFHLSSFIFHLSSFIFHLSSFIFHLSSFIFHLLSFIFYLLSFIFHLSSLIFHLSSFIFLPFLFTLYL